MRLPLCAAAVLMSASTAAAQIPIKKTVDVASGNTSLMLVATPYVAGASTSDPAVKIGEAMRARLSRLAGGHYDVITRESMNKVISRSGFDADALLAPGDVTALASRLRVKVVVQSTLEQLADGRVKVTAKLESTSGQTAEATATQDAGQSLEAVGAALAEGLKDGLK